MAIRLAHPSHYSALAIAQREAIINQREQYTFVHAHGLAGGLCNHGLADGGNVDERLGTVGLYESAVQDSTGQVRRI